MAATTTLKVEGMTCGACTSAIDRAFNGVPGVGSVSVSLVMERAVVTHDRRTISAHAVKDIIEDCGFDAEVLSSDAADAEDDDDDSEGEAHQLLDPIEQGYTTSTLRVGGMTCGACTSAVEGACRDVAGIKTFNVSLLAERAVIEHDSNIIAPEALAELIEDVGFDAELLDVQISEPLSSSKSGKQRSKKLVESKKLVTTTVAVEGMTCGACTSAIQSAFKDMPGLVSFNVSLLAERAVASHDPALLTANQVASAIEDCGFDARILSSHDEGVQVQSTDAIAHLKIFGLPSPEAADNLQVALQNTHGIVSSTINFSTYRAKVVHRPTQIGLRAIVEIVENAGYNALVADNDDNNAQLESLAKTKEIHQWARAFRISLAFAIPVFLISMIFPMFIPALDIGSTQLPIVPGLWLGDVICLILTIPVQFGVGKRFYENAFRSIKHGSPTMDVLVVLGTSAAFFFSCAAMLVSIFCPPHSRPATTFDTSTMLITFITLGRFLENRAKGQTSRALSRLMSLAPSTATIYTDPIAAAKAADEWDVPEETKDSDAKSRTGSAMEERTVPTELIELGDIVVLKPGDKIPADGIVMRRESYVNESMVTGEALPILKKPGSMLMAGTVNGAGRLDFKVIRAGRDTQLSQIVRLVQEAQTTRAPIQRVADTLAGYFVPVIITLGLATFVGWMVVSHLLPSPPPIFAAETSGGAFMVCVKLCIAVIVFACPCALGLATPTAVMVGTGVGAEQGILVKGGSALETATKINHVVLDKTGTLTMGKMSVSRADIVDSWSSNSDRRRLWWTVVGLAEQSSEHPIAKAILAGARERLGVGADGQIEGTAGTFEVVVGKGIIATVEPPASLGTRERQEAIIGNAMFLHSRGIKFTEESDVGAVRVTDNANAGITKIHVAIAGAYAGSISLSDTLKPTARAAIAALHRMRITTSLVTGDQLPAALHVASLVGIPKGNVHAAVLPAGKQSLIASLQEAGAVVAMVGDGINDSPALATADIGVSLSDGTDVAVEAADIVLMKPSQLTDIPASLHLSKTIFRRIKLNLALSCAYNAIGLPVAMGFLLPWGISLPPLAAGAAMACSSVTVVISSLLLRFWTRPSWMEAGEADDEAAAAAVGIAKNQAKGFWTRVGALRGLGKTGDGRGGQRGKYVQLESYEEV